MRVSSVSSADSVSTTGPDGGDAVDATPVAGRASPPTDGCRRRGGRAASARRGGAGSCWSTVPEPTADRLPLEGGGWWSEGSGLVVGRWDRPPLPDRGQLGIDAGGPVMAGSGVGRRRLLAALLGLQLGLGLGIVLDGSAHSFAQYPRWQPGLNGSLQFEFRTTQPSGLLLYTDDGGKIDFFEVKLVEGSLSMRFNLGSGPKIVRMGRGLNDGRWHRVTIAQHHARTTLTVDHITEHWVSRGDQFTFDVVSNQSHVYVGGVPHSMRVAKLALPTARLEPRLAGEVRNLVYSGVDGVERRQDMKHFKVCS